MKEKKDVYKIKIPCDDSCPKDCKGNHYLVTSITRLVESEEWVRGVRRFDEG